MPNPNAAIIEAQQACLTEAIGAAVDGVSSYALVDFPNHANVGDSAIWLGEIALLEKITGRLPAYVSTGRSFSPAAFARACPSGPILIHGGGNFGDIWRNHQRFRERLLKQFPDRHIIQLPQSIKFRDPANVGTCRRLIGEHRRFTLFVRDRQSLAFAGEHFDCPAQLIPDSAFGLGPLERPAPPTHEVVLLLRTDLERRDYDLSRFAVLERSLVIDWLEEPARLSVKMGALLKLERLLGIAFATDNPDLVRYDRLAWHRVDRGLRILGDGEYVITDRLHAHILCTLLGLPHVALDNDYGKVSGYIDAWNGASPSVRKALSAEDAVEQLAHLRQQESAGHAVSVRHAVDA